MQWVNASCSLIRVLPACNGRGVSLAVRMGLFCILPVNPLRGFTCVYYFLLFSSAFILPSHPSKARMQSSSDLAGHAWDRCILWIETPVNLSDSGTWSTSCIISANDSLKSFSGYSSALSCINSRDTRAPFVLFYIAYCLHRQSQLLIIFPLLRSPDPPAPVFHRRTRRRLRCSRRLQPRIADVPFAQGFGTGTILC